jgi:hypothetical protein
VLDFIFCGSAPYPNGNEIQRIRGPNRTPYILSAYLTNGPTLARPQLYSPGTVRHASDP